MIVFRENPVNSELDIPLFQQLYTHLQNVILSGDLKPGTRLPSTHAWQSNSMSHVTPFSMPISN